MKTIPVTKGDRRRGGGKRNKVDVSLPVDITLRLNTSAKQFHAMPGKNLCLIRNSILFIYFKNQTSSKLLYHYVWEKQIKTFSLFMFLSLSQVLNLFFQWKKIYVQTPSVHRELTTSPKSDFNRYCMVNFQRKR